MWFRAKRCDEALADLRSLSVAGKVQGVYNRCFHLLLEDSRLITVFGDIADIMPMSVCTDGKAEAPFDNVPLEPGQQAVISCGILAIPQAGFLCTLQMQSVSLLRGRLPPPVRLQELRETLLAQGKPRGAGQWLPQWVEYLDWGSPLPEDAVILHRFTRLLSAVEQDAEGIREALSKLVGLGIGLTPSADDMICGLCAAICLWWPEKKGRIFLDTLTDYCCEYGKLRTTFVSCQQLERTAKGFLSDPVYELGRTISGQGGDLNLALENVTEYGSSSGTELCMGLLAGIYAAISF